MTTRNTAGSPRDSEAEGLATPIDAFTTEGKRSMVRVLDLVERMSPVQRLRVIKAAEASMEADLARLEGSR